MVRDLGMKGRQFWADLRVLAQEQRLFSPLRGRQKRARDRDDLTEQGALYDSALASAGGVIWVPVCLAYGIAAWFALWWEPPLWHYGVVVLLMAGLFPLARGQSGRALVARAVMLFLAGMIAAGLRANLQEAPVLGFRYYGVIEGRLIAVDRSGADKLRLTLDQVRLDGVGPPRTPARVRVSLLHEATPPVIGARVRAKGHLGPPPPPSEPGGFDFRRYAWFAKLGAIGYLRDAPEVIAPPDNGGLGQKADRLRSKLSQSVQSHIGGQAGAVAAALLTGDRSGISQATNNDMRAANLYHVVAISGLHMGILAGFVYAAARWFFLFLGMMNARVATWPMHKLAAGVALIAAAIYLWVSGGAVATERAFITVAVMLVAILLDRRALSLRSLALAATIILLFTPEALLSAGFQMSFAATIGLILSLGVWRRIAPYTPALVRPLVMLMFSSLVAGLVTAPIAAAHFGRIAHYGVLANLLAVPVMGTVIMPAGVMAVLAAPFGVEAPFLWLVGQGTGWILTVAHWIAGLGGAVSAVPAPPALVLPLLAGAVFLAVLAHQFGRARLGMVLGFGVGGLAFVLWAVLPRPAILVSPEGDAVGIMTEAGRALSKEKGGRFAVESWLDADGDLAGMMRSARRPLWQGPSNRRVADLGHGWRIAHLTGKKAGQMAVETCTEKVVLISNQNLPMVKNGPCLLLDLWVLRHKGAARLSMTPDGPRIIHDAKVRLWQRPPRTRAKPRKDGP